MAVIEPGVGDRAAKGLGAGAAADIDDLGALGESTAEPPTGADPSAIRMALDGLEG
jgi:hypothetical protein